MASRMKQDLKEGMKGVKELLSLAKSDFVNNSKDLKQDFKEILEMARTKRRSKQESKAYPSLDANINPDAGAELLTHYRLQWGAIHRSILSSSEVSAAIFSMVTETEQTARTTKDVITKCHAEFSALPAALEDVQKTREKVQGIVEALRKVEGAIEEYCQVAARAEAHRKRRGEAAALETHRTERQLEVQRYELSLSEEQRLLSEEQARQEQEKLQERQRNYGELFEREMSVYKEKGELDRPSMPGCEHQSSLETITLDYDGATLDKFLEGVEDVHATPHAGDGATGLEESLESETEETTTPSRDLEPAAPNDK